MILRSRKKLASMKREDYIDKSLINWIPAARGIITLIKREIDENNNK